MYIKKNKYQGVAFNERCYLIIPLNTILPYYGKFRNIFVKTQVDERYEYSFKKYFNPLLLERMLSEKDRLPVGLFNVFWVSHLLHKYIYKCENIILFSKCGQIVVCAKIYIAISSPNTFLPKKYVEGGSVKSWHLNSKE